MGPSDSLVSEKVTLLHTAARVGVVAPRASSRAKAVRARVRGLRGRRNTACVRGLAIVKNFISVSYLRVALLSSPVLLTGQSSTKLRHKSTRSIVVWSSFL